MYYIVPFIPGETYLVYSKMRTNNLPLMTTSVELQPCIKPGQTSQSETAPRYPTELEQIGCIFDEFTETKYDPRFIDLGYSIDEYQVQEESGVLSKLTDIKGYSDYISDVTLKKSEIYNFWARPTIPWKLKCENDPNSSSRKQITDAARDTAAASHEI